MSVFSHTSGSAVTVKTTKDRLRFLTSIFSRYKKEIAFFLLLEAGISILGAIIPYFTKLQIDQLEKPSTQFLGFSFGHPFLIFVVALLVPILIQFFRQFILDYFTQRANARFETNIRLETESLIWQKLETLDAGFFENKRNHRLLSWILGASSITTKAFSFFRQRFSNVIGVVAIIPLLGLVSWQLMVLVAVATVFQVILNDISRKQEAALNIIQDKQNERYWRVSSALSRNFQILRILGATKIFLKEYMTLFKERDTYDFKRQHERQRLQVLEWFVSNSLTLAANIYVGWSVLQGDVSIGTFSLVISYTFQLNSIFLSFASSIKEWQEVSMQFDQLQFFFMLQPRIKSSSEPRPIPKNPTTLTVKNVYFTYPDFFAEERSYIEMMIQKIEKILKSNWSYYLKYELEDWQKVLQKEEKNEAVLEGVNLELTKGKIIALLGRNGAGKTTITQLLMHQYEPDKGDVTLNHTALHMFSQHELLQLFGIIQQRPFILDQFSIRENLLLGVHREVSDDEIWQLLEKMDLKDKIETLPKKLDTILGEDTSFSGGQEQLLAVARILLQQRPFLIFDEGMNQMDIEHETKIVELLREQKKHSGILFITHRITTARKADYIFMLDEGKIAEEGTHEQLMKSNGLYAKFWNMQVIE